ncbi:MAG TPA: beta-propeller domain-containing protein [Polyangiaceae bacterium]|jgi:hypothetical protein
MRSHPLWSSLGTAALSLASVSIGLAACSGSSGTGGPSVGQTEFSSAPPYGASSGSALTTGNATAGGASKAGAQASSVAPAAGAAGDSASTPRTVQETDLYRVEGNRLYYLNSYRGLMVFDITQVDQPKLLGRSPVYGTPVQMFVENGIATVVVADWYGTLGGAPFHGSIVRGLDATDPTQIKVLGEAKLGGWVQDTRVVGSNVLYAVSEDYGWTYGYGAVSSAAQAGPTVIVSSVSFAGGIIQEVASKSYPGYGGVFNVTPDSIMLAHPALSSDGIASTQTALQYLDISDPGGNIVERGSVVVDGSVQGWGADNGRWNLDFADGVTAHVIGCNGAEYGCNGSGYELATVDFSNPDRPNVLSEVPVASTTWAATARFDGTGAAARMYLSPTYGYGYSGGPSGTPLEVFDLSNPAAPALAGQVQIPGNVWIMIPAGNQLFALGQDDNATSSDVSLKYLDVSDAASPSLIGTSDFGDGWAWTPAADTFKAFTMDSTDGLVVLPFSGWSASTLQYNNGVQLIEYTPPSSGTGGSLVTAGAAFTKGWVERGIIANGRILSLSDQALSVVDYSNPAAPTVTGQLTLARNVVAAQPAGTTVAEISSDWWGNDQSQSEVRMLPSTDADENTDESSAPTVDVAGVNARVFTNGTFSYVVTTVQVPAPCPPPSTGSCTTWQQQIQVVDLAGGTARARGVVKLPADPYFYGYAPWGGCFVYDWYYGGDIVQVDATTLAFRRWYPTYGASGQYVSAASDLFAADLSNPDAPTVSSLVITDDPNGWWGNMQVVGDVLYTTHYVWSNPTATTSTVRYYLDAIDLSDRKNPRVTRSINVPGFLVGGSATDPSLLYTIDYQWSNGSSVNQFDVVRVTGNVARLESSTPLDGWVGNVIVRGNTAYTTTQSYDYDPTTNLQNMELHQIDLTNPSGPVDRVASSPGWWGWLLDVEGDRMLVSSGWGDAYSPPGIDIYRLSPGAPPAYDQFARTNGWWVGSSARQNDQIFLTSGYWGVQTVNLD